jgi:hypothetical protein
MVRKMIMLDIFIASLILWLLWIATGNLVNAHRRRNYTGLKLKLTKAWVYFFVAIDVLFNVTYGTIVFMQLPAMSRLTLTHRLRYILLESNAPMDWRFKLADFICRRMVSPWDPNHCGLGYD